jgi:hypothetical protein
MRRLALLGSVAMVLATAVPVLAQEAVPSPVLNDQALFHKYVASTLGASGMLHASLAAAFDQVRHSPDDWDLDGTGYGKRWVSEFAESVIGSTTKYGVAKLFHQDPSFTRCACRGVRRRIRHALVSPFVARTMDGRQVFSPATIAGLAAEHIVPASSWYPAPHGTRDGVLDTVSGVVVKATVDVIREFVPIKPFR